MDLEYSDEHRLFADAIGSLLADACPFEKRRASVAARAWGDPALWAALAELGCLALMIPAAAGGLDGKAIDLAVMARALGRHLVIEPVRQAVMSGLLLGPADGAAPERDDLASGAKRYAVATAAPADGTNILLPGCDGADGILLASEDTLWLIDAKQASLVPVQLLDDSMAADAAFDIRPARALAVGGGWAAARAKAIAYDRLFLCFEAMGSMDAALAQTTAYVSERRQFGRAIAEFQVVQHRIAEMVVASREAEAVALLAALTIDATGPGTAADRALAAAISRIAAAAELVADGAVQLHGGMGVSDETPVAAHFRKLQAFRLLAGRMDDVADTMVATGAHHRSAVLIEA